MMSTKKIKKSAYMKVIFFVKTTNDNRKRKLLLFSKCKSLDKIHLARKQKCYCCSYQWQSILCMGLKEYQQLLLKVQLHYLVLPKQCHPQSKTFMFDFLCFQFLVFLLKPLFVMRMSCHKCVRVNDSMINISIQEVSVISVEQEEMFSMKCYTIYHSTMKIYWYHRFFQGEGGFGRNFTQIIIKCN